MLGEPYWAAIDWKALGVFLGVVGTLSSPYVMEWWKGRLKKLESQTKALETNAERIDRLQREQYDRVAAEREHYLKRTREAEADQERAEQRADEARMLAVAMADWAHWYQNGLVKLTTRFRLLVLIVEEIGSGTAVPERVAILLADARTNVPVNPPVVPLLRDAATVRPPA